jgi:hypothetical protein
VSLLTICFIYFYTGRRQPCVTFSPSVSYISIEDTVYCIGRDMKFHGAVTAIGSLLLGITLAPTVTDAHNPSWNTGSAGSTSTSRQLLWSSVFVATSFLSIPTTAMAQEGVLVQEEHREQQEHFHLRRREQGTEGLESRFLQFGGDGNCCTCNCCACLVDPCNFCGPTFLDSIAPPSPTGVQEEDTDDKEEDTDDKEEDTDPPEDVQPPQEDVKPAGGGTFSFPALDTLPTTASSFPGGFGTFSFPALDTVPTTASSFPGGFGFPPANAQEDGDAAQDTNLPPFIFAGFPANNGPVNNGPIFELPADIFGLPANNGSTEASEAGAPENDGGAPENDGGTPENDGDVAEPSDSPTPEPTVPIDEDEPAGTVIFLGGGPPCGDILPNGDCPDEGCNDLFCFGSFVCVRPNVRC